MYLWQIFGGILIMILPIGLLLRIHATNAYGFTTPLYFIIGI